MELVETNSVDLVGRVANETDSEKKKSFILDYIREAEGCPSWFSLTGSSDIFGGSEWMNCNRKLEFSDLSQKFILLDFFTYCCINCIHIMPFLHKLESKFSMTDGLIIVGIHSAKFPNEKVETNIKNAIARYNLRHPVLNDSEIKVWEEFSVKCWPTLILISPNGKVLFSLPGESHAEFIELFLDMALEVYEAKKELDKKPVNFFLLNENSAADDNLSGILKLSFPGKIAIDASGERIAVSDSGNHRVIISDLLGNVHLVIGGPGAGYSDGSFEKAMFDSPQGVTWHGQNTVFVADCNNHAVRKIDLLVKKVVTICGTGVQGNDLAGGRPGLDQPISSPWDLVVGGSPRFADGKSILYVAMSGCHQIWAFFLKTTDYQKGVEMKMGTCIRYAGNGNEENRNNSYPHKAGFAQPSGLAIDEDGHVMYVADSESSTIKKINLSNGAVQPLVGGDIDPMDLFSFGDVDGKGRDAKLQHPIGAAWDHKKNVLYVADTYNHKIKIIDAKKTCNTMEGLKDADGRSVFSEPSGLTIDPACENLYIADTNNHDIKVLALKDYTVRSLALKLKSFFDSLSLEEADGPKSKIATPITRKNTRVKSLSGLVVHGHGDVIFTLTYPSFVLSPDAPSMWQITCFQQRNDHGSDGSFHVASGKFEAGDSTVIALKASQVLRASQTEKSQNTLPKLTTATVCVEGVLYYCVENSGVCKMHNYKAHLPFEVLTEYDGRDSKPDPIELTIEI